MSKLAPAAREIIAGRHADPFSYLGPHRENDETVLRVFLPERAARGRRRREAASANSIASTMPACSPDRSTACAATGCARVSATTTSSWKTPTALRRCCPTTTFICSARATHLRLYDKLGAHPMTLDGVEGVAFVVWAPNARRVSVVGDFNFWDGRRHAMRVRGNGYWEIFVPGARADDNYKYEIVGAHRASCCRSNPIRSASARRCGPRPPRSWSTSPSCPARKPAPANVNALDAPMSIYEVHLGSWRKKGEHGEYWLTYRDLAEQLPAYAADMGFTHVELLPVTEHPFDGSWGYQPTGLFAPTSRFGSPADFVASDRRLHQAGIGVLLDWVPGHFPDDPHGLARFDGTALYEHADPRQGRHLDWGTHDLQLRPRRSDEFPAANALFWLERYGVDGLRVDAVASMLYLDYSRPAGELGAEQIRRARKHRRHRLPAPHQHRSCSGSYPHATTAAEEFDRLADGVAAGRLGRARLRLQMEHGLDARHLGLHFQGPDLPPLSSRQHPVRAALRLLGKFHPAAVA